MRKRQFGGQLYLAAAAEVRLMYCDACGREATYHLTLTVDVVGAQTTRVKTAQLWLCDDCEKKNRVLLENRDGRAGRVARAITPRPAHWRPDEEFEADKEAYRRVVESGLERGGV